MMKLVLKLVVLLVSWNAIAQQGQDTTTLSVSTTINSRYLDETRPVDIQLPDSYFQSPSRHYPVLYVLDGQNLFEHTKYISNYLHSKGYIPEMIIVSIPHTGERNRDYKTFHRETTTINEGANHFLSFIEKELIAHVEKNYRTKEYRMLSGHSNAGLFVIHSLMKRPELFHARFAFSASSHHIPQQRVVLKEFLKNTSELVGYFYMNVGGKEFYKQTDSFTEIKQMFETHAPVGLRYDFDFHEADGHRTTPFTGQSMAFKRLFGPWKLGTNYDTFQYEELVAHFDGLSKEFKEPIKPDEKELISMAHYFLAYVPKKQVLQNVIKLMQAYYPESPKLTGIALFYENWLEHGMSKQVKYTDAKKPDARTLNRTAYWYFRDKKFEEVFYLLKLAVALYPDVSNTYSELGEAYEYSGELKKARKNYKKALQVAQGNEEEAEVITDYQAKIDRINEALKTKQNE